MLPPSGTGYLGASAALAAVLCLAGLAQGCPPPGSQFAFPDGFWRNDTSSESTLARRWTAIEFGDGTEKLNNDGLNHFGKQWPGGTIPLCFDSTFTQDEEDQIVEGFLKGITMWYISGLSPSSWKIDVSLTRTECQNQGVTGPKENYLWVQRSDLKGMASSTGNSVTGSVFDAQPDSYWKTLKGVPDPLQQKTRQYAHEIGHVFGLLHEHQNPTAWSKERGGTGAADKFELDCTALADYDQCLRYVKDLFDYDAAKVADYMTEMCATNLGPWKYPCKDTQGNNIRLSAWNWLPEVGSQQFVRTGGQLDLKSVMIYDSFSGNKAPGVPVFYLLDGSGGKKTLKPDDGYELYPPSPLDAEGAVLLSPNPREATDNPPYFTAASSQNPTWEAAGNGFSSCSTDPFDDCNAPSPASTASDPFDDCKAMSPSRKRSVTGHNRRHENLMRRGAEARAAMKGRLLATGSYF